MNEELKISIQTGGWYNDLFDGDERVDEAFRFIRKYDFDTLDYNINNTLPYGEILSGNINTFYDADIEELLERYRPVKEAMIRYGISFGQAHAPFPMYIEGADDINNYLIMVVEKECAICQYLECPALVVHPYSCADKGKEKEINLAMYRKLIPAAKKYGIKLCLENMYRFANGHGTVGACGDAKEACWYIDTLNEEAGEDIFGFCFDVGHANISGRNIREEVRTLGHRLTALHIHENDGINDLHQIPYALKHSSGQKLYTDWEGFIEGLRDINYRGTLNFETFAALRGTPYELVPSMLKLIYEVGCYFKKRIQE